MPLGRKGGQLKRRADDRGPFLGALDRIHEDARRASRRSKARVKQRSGTISESVRLVRGADGGTIAMRIEYLAAIALAAVAVGTGLAVHSVGSLPPEKQYTPAATQLALAKSVEPFLLRSGG
jgi:hypothetical protein